MELRMSLSTYEITFQTLSGWGLHSHRARDMMSCLTLLRLDGAKYRATLADKAIVITITCDIPELAAAAQNLAPAWATVDTRTGRSVTHGGETYSETEVVYTIPVVEN